MRRNTDQDNPRIQTLFFAVLGEGIINFGKVRSNKTDDNKSLCSRWYWSMANFSLRKMSFKKKSKGNSLIAK